VETPHAPSCCVRTRFVDRDKTHVTAGTIGRKAAKIATQRPMPWGRVAVLDFNDFFYFLQVVDRGGFTTAGCPKIAAGKDVECLWRLLPRRDRR
jgi:hypothetical protein